MRSLRLLPVLVLFAFHAVANVVPVKPAAPASREEVRKQLAAFFAGGGVGDLNKSPGTLEAVQTRIAAMSDEELAQFQKFIADDPNWRNIPKTMAAAIPPEVMKSFERAGADLTRRIPDAERMRDDIRTLTTVLRMLPDAKLEELGISRQTLDSLDGAFAALSPLQAAMLQKQIIEISGWNAASTSAMAALPPAMREGALALAKHGPLTDEDRKELEQFRTDLVQLLGNARKLPASMRPSAVPEQFQQQIDHITAARPEVLFMIRQQLPAEKLATLRENVAVLDRVAHLTDRERAALESFRADVVNTFTRLQPAGTPDDSVRASIARLSSGDLLMLKDKLAAVPEWKELPLYYRAVSAPDFSARIAAVSGPAPDAARLSELQAFRAQALQYIQAAAGEEGVDAALVQRASKVVAGADPPHLELIRSVAAEMGEMTAHNRLSLIAHGSCEVDIGLDTISFNFICGPIDDVFDKVKDVYDKVKDIPHQVDDVHDDLNEARTNVHHLVSTLDHLYDNVDEARTNIHRLLNDMDDLPGLASDAFKAALDKLLNINIGSGISVRELTNTDTTIASSISQIRTAFRVGSSTWWTHIADVQLPDIPCPAAGTHTVFGDVGSGDAVTRYNRYNFFLGKLAEVIPDTETSLVIKIPVEVLHTAYEFLGICLQDAADDANDQLLEDRHTSITNGIGNLSSGIGSLSSQVAANTGAVSTQLTNTYNALVTDRNAQTNILTSATAAAGAALSNQLTSNTAQLSNQLTSSTTQLTNQSTSSTAQLSSQSTSSTTQLSNQLTSSTTQVSNQLTSSTTQLSNQVSSSTTQLSNQLTSSTTQLSNQVDAKAEAQRALDLRLQIELNLASGQMLAMFQLPQVQGGYLELVRDTVNNDITSMLAAGQSINQAQRYYSDALTAISQARYKDALKSLQTAYRELTK